MHTSYSIHSLCAKHISITLMVKKICVFSNEHTQHSNHCYNHLIFFQASILVHTLFKSHYIGYMMMLRLSRSQIGIKCILTNSLWLFSVLYRFYWHLSTQIFFLVSSRAIKKGNGFYILTAWSIEFTTNHLWLHTGLMISYYNDDYILDWWYISQNFIQNKGS